MDSHYSTGTATVNSNATNVIGQGTSWLDVIRPGDLFGTHKGFAIRIASVNSNTSITLANNWPGASQAAQPYEIQMTPYAANPSRTLQTLIDLLGSGNNYAFGALNGVANRLIKFTGAGTLALFDSRNAEAMSGLTTAADKIIYWTGAYTAALTNFTAIGRAVVGAADEAAAQLAIGLQNAALTNVANTFTQYQTVSHVEGVRSHNFAMGSGYTRPSDYWSASGHLFCSNGVIGTYGSFAMSFTWNGYRSTSNNWVSLAQNGFPGGGQIDLQASGIAFRFQSSAISGLFPSTVVGITDGNMYPGTTNTVDLGSTSFRWRNIYLNNNPNVASDERGKLRRNETGELTDAECRAGVKIGNAIMIYQRKHVVESGENARLHCGVSAQEVASIMESEGLNPTDYSFYCYDPLFESKMEMKTVQVNKEIEVETGEVDTDNNPIKKIVMGKVDEEHPFDVNVPVLDAEGKQIIQLSIRYEQLAMFVAAAQATQLASIMERLTILES